MMHDYKRGKFNAMGIKYLFVDCCEEIKNYRLTCLQTKKIHKKNKNVIFMEDSMSVGNNLEMRLMRRNDSLTVVVMDEMVSLQGRHAHHHICSVTLH